MPTKPISENSDAYITLGEYNRLIETNEKLKQEVLKWKSDYLQKENQRLFNDIDSLKRGIHEIMRLNDSVFIIATKIDKILKAVNRLTVFTTVMAIGLSIYVCYQHNMH